MKSYEHIKRFVKQAKENINYFDKKGLTLTFDNFLDNWSANYDTKDITNLKILMDFQTDFEDGLYTKETSKFYVHYKFTEAAKEIIRFRELL